MLFILFKKVVNKIYLSRLMLCLRLIPFWGFVFLPEVIIIILALHVRIKQNILFEKFLCKHETLYIYKIILVSYIIGEQNCLSFYSIILIYVKVFLTRSPFEEKLVIQLTAWCTVCKESLPSATIIYLIEHHSFHKEYLVVTEKDRGIKGKFFCASTPIVKTLCIISLNNSGSIMEHPCHFNFFLRPIILPRYLLSQIDPQ